MVTLALLQEPVMSYEDGAGKPLSGGKLYTYSAGTLTPKSTYQNAAGTTYNTNPIVLNARGEATVFGTGNYRMILRDAQGNTIWDRDNVNTLSGAAIQAAADAAAARDAAQQAGNVFPDIATGIAGTTSGKYFSVPVQENNQDALILYLNTSGVATEITRYPSTWGNSQFQTAAAASAAAAAASAVNASTSASAALASQIAAAASAAAAAASAAAAAAVVTGGTASLTPAAGKLPIAGGTSFIDAGWLPFLQSGVATATRITQDKLREFVSLKDFGAIGDGASHPLSSRYPTLLLAQSFYPFVTSLSDEIDWAATQAMLNEAASSQRDALTNNGTFVINRTVTMGRCRLYGMGDGSRFKPTITDGSPMLDVVATANHFSLVDFRVDSAIDFNAWMAGTINAQPCTGIRMNTSGPNFAARFSVRNVLVNGAAIGWDVLGFIGSMENLWATSCELGLRGNQMNSVRINARFETNRKDFEIVNSNGIHFDQLLQETSGQVGCVPSTIDGSAAIAFSALYLEHPNRHVPFIKVGFSAQCRNISIPTASCGMPPTSGNFDVTPIQFDMVDGLDVDGYWVTGFAHSSVSTTVNTKNIRSLPSFLSVGQWAQDNSKNLSVVRNLFPNPNFDLWFRGWGAVSFTNSVMSKETTLVRRGPNAVRITANAGSTTSSINFALNDAVLATFMRGKSLTMYAWVWIPNLSVFDPSFGAAMPFKPAIQLLSNNGTVSTSTLSSNNSVVRNAWNLLRVTHTLQSDSIRMDATVFLSTNGGQVAAGTEYCVVDSIYVVEGDGGNNNSILNGNVADSPLNPVQGIGGKLVQRVGGTTIPFDANQTYEIGDQFLYQSVFSGGFLGEIATTAGAGNTIVKKTFGAISA